MNLFRDHRKNMESLKQEALNVIKKVPDSAEIDDIMYSFMLSIKFERAEKLHSGVRSYQLKI